MVSGSARLIDDYGHHPTEVAVTLQAARDAFHDQRVVMVYQPHPSPTRDHFDEFVSVLGEAQFLILLDVYPAGESAIEGADAQSLARAIRARGVLEPVVVSDQRQLAAVLAGVLCDGDILLMQGAGDIGRLSAHWPTVIAGGLAMTANPFSGKTLAVMLGGTAAERSISLESGENVARALEQAGAQVLRVDTAEEGWPERLKEASFVFNLLHGPVVRMARCRAYSSS